MSGAVALGEAVIEHSDVGVLTLIGGYLAYEIRFGAIAEVRDNQRTLAVALYRVIEKDSDLDEETFRSRFWSEDNGGMIPGDLDTEPPDGEV